MWNGYSMIRKRPELTEGMMQTLEEAEHTLLKGPGNKTWSSRLKQSPQTKSCCTAYMWICPFTLQQKMNIQWMTAVWSTCWRVCVWRTRVASRTLRNASKKCFPGELQWIYFKCLSGYYKPFSQSFFVCWQRSICEFRNLDTVVGNMAKDTSAI